MAQVWQRVHLAMTLFRRAIGVAMGALACLSAQAVQAQTDDASRDVTVFGWAVSGRVSANLSPDYLGSNDYKVGPSVSLSFHRSGQPRTYHAPDDSTDFQLLGGETLSGGLIVRARSRRDDSGDLQGIHKVGFALEPGVYAEWWPADGLRLRGEARRGVMGNSAWSGDVAADLVHDDPRWLLSIGPRVHLGDSRFTRTYFDITAADAARSPFGIGPYAQDKAFVSWGGLASAEYRWSPRWSVLTNASYQRLLGDAADSPIVAHLGSPNQYKASIGVRYRLGR